MKKTFYSVSCIVLLIMLQSCTKMSSKPLAIGHRGAMGHETENTLASVQKALDLGADMIEIDVFEIRSGEIMVFHDERVDRLTNGGGLIEEYNYWDSQILILDGNHKIPMLQDVLRLIDNRARLNVELKGAKTSDRVNYILEYYIENEGWERDKFIISSFNWDELRSFRNYNENIAIAVLTDGDPLEAIPVAKELGAEAINPYFETLNKEVVDQIHKAGFKVYTWTVNNEDDIKRVTNMGVDGIISDFPERVR